MRAAIFIDGGYFLKHIQDASASVDYAQLASYLLAPVQPVNLDLMRCYFYYCPPYMSPEPTEEETRRMAAHEKFVTQLEAIDRWQFRKGKLEKRREGDRDVFSQKRVDVMLSVDLVRHAAAGHVQHALLVAGDSDFIPAVRAAKEEGVTITLWCAHDRSAHKDLMALCDEVRFFDFGKIPRIDKPKPRSSGSKRGGRRKKAASGDQKKVEAPQPKGAEPAANEPNKPAPAKSGGTRTKKRTTTRKKASPRRDS